MPIDPIIAPFKEISLNWIIKLPKAEKRGQKYNAILTIMD